MNFFLNRADLQNLCNLTLVNFCFDILHQQKVLPLGYLCFLVLWWSLTPTDLCQKRSRHIPLHVPASPVLYGSPLCINSIRIQNATMGESREVTGQRNAGAPKSAGPRPL